MHTHTKDELNEKSKGELIDMMMSTKDGDKCGCNCEACAKCEGVKQEDKDDDKKSDK